MSCIGWLRSIRRLRLLRSVRLRLLRSVRLLRALSERLITGRTRLERTRMQLALVGLGYRSLNG